VTDRELELRRRIFDAFAETGLPPALDDAQAEVVEALERAHVIVRDDAGAIVMAHPFARPGEGTTLVEHSSGTWHGSCAWDGLGIAAALGLSGYTVRSNGITAGDDTVFHVAVPAAHWWDDIAHT
jgi:hypothetical protein